MADRPIRAVLLDVFETVVTVDFDAVLDGLVTNSDLTREELVAAVESHGQAMMAGGVTLAETFTTAFELAGKPVGDVEVLVAHDRTLLQQHATLHPDVVPFIDEVRSRGIAVAFVSNCAANAGPLLDTLGLSTRADHVALSCEVGAVKPDPVIYLAALAALARPPSDSLFVDDQAAYCDGAEALGMRAVRIDRRNGEPGTVRSLHELLPLF